MTTGGSTTMSLNEQCFQGAERERWWLVARGMQPRYQR